MNRKLLYVLIAVAAGLITLYFAPATGLTITGQRLMGALVFIIVIWSTESCLLLSYFSLYATYHHDVGQCNREN
ncbi:MAG: hypothetical protein AB9917_18355 [Negativicutes bacterium]